ncbi:MAG TPA: UDP-glucose/GDP-mannose dehydrogenase family protein [Spirochaetota bacterium]|nr:UDP-glucose/GDP-mannose dehydrogenase family protein [Spirochaetota bacterium]HOM38862.1 UDP-glucose/GDP-mannose dehydrogenase family protein [Spirochaetota bacterium]HPQ49157.1 UDP-glucose/GDP-mannose dehydrogenase family protein [Spirochaetota bacterium]
MNITVVGVGYVGLVTGAGLAEMGNNVWCIDVDERKIENLKNGIIPIYEPGLEPLVKSNYYQGRLKFSTELCEGLLNSEIVMIAVGTPPNEDGSADLKYVIGVAKDIAKHMDNYKIIITKSTVPVGTGDIIENIIKEELVKRGLSIDFDVVSNPEFLKEGEAVSDFLKPDRIIIGVNSERAYNIMKDLYLPFERNGVPVFIMDRLSSEMTKYAANCMLATRISFMNEISRLCEKVGADITKVKLGIGSDPRIGMSFLNAGLGYGGSCFPKDVKALIKTFEENNIEPKILKSVDETNKEQRMFFIEKILGFYKNDIKDKTFSVWGLSFKPKTDDMREAASITIINYLREKGAFIRAYDPVAIENARLIFGNENIEYFNDEYKVLKGSDALIIVTEWPQFREPDFKLIKKLLNRPVIFDGRNIYIPERLKELGFEYFSIGR